MSLYAPQPISITTQMIKDEFSAAKLNIQDHPFKTRNAALQEQMDAVSRILEQMTGLNTKSELIFSKHWIVTPARWNTLWNAIKKDLDNLFTIQNAIEKTVVSHFNYSEAEYIWIDSIVNTMDARLDRIGIMNNAKPQNLKTKTIDFADPANTDITRTTLRIDNISKTVSLYPTMSDNILTTKLKNVTSNSQAVIESKSQRRTKTIRGTLYYGQRYGIISDQLTSAEDVPRPEGPRSTYYGNIPSQITNRIIDVRGYESNPDTYAEAELCIVDNALKTGVEDKIKTYVTSLLTKKGETIRNLNIPTIATSSKFKNEKTEMREGLYQPPKSDESIFGKESINTYQTMTLEYTTAPTSVSKINILPFTFANNAKLDIERIVLKTEGGQTKTIARRNTTEENLILSNNVSMNPFFTTTTGGSDFSIKPVQGTTFLFNPIKNVNTIIFVFRNTKSYYLKHTLFLEKRSVLDSTGQQTIVNGKKLVDVRLVLPTDQDDVLINLYNKTKGNSIDQPFPATNGYVQSVYRPASGYTFFGTIDIEANDSNILRYALGIRDISVTYEKYQNSGSIVTTPIEFKNAIKEVYINANESIGGLNRESVRYFILFGDEEIEKEIIPIEYALPANNLKTGAPIPTIIYVNRNIPMEMRNDPAGAGSYFDSDQPVTKIKLRVDLKTNNDEITPVVYSVKVNALIHTGVL